MKHKACFIYLLFIVYILKIIGFFLIRWSFGENKRIFGEYFREAAGCKKFEKKN